MFKSISDSLLLVWLFPLIGLIEADNEDDVIKTSSSRMTFETLTSTGAGQAAAATVATVDAFLNGFLGLLLGGAL